MKIKFLKDHRIEKAKLNVVKDQELVVANVLGKQLIKEKVAIVLVDEYGNEVVNKK